jgi:chromosome segregation ATPase
MPMVHTEHMAQTVHMVHAGHTRVCYLGLLWPNNVRSFLWGSQSPKDNESMKNSIQHIKKIVAFEDEESPLKSKFDSVAKKIEEIRILNFEGKETELEVKLNSMIVEIKNDVESKRDEIIEEMNELKSKNDQMMKELNDCKSKNDEMNRKMDAILGFIEKLSKENQTEGSISGDNDTRSLDVPETASVLTDPAEKINQHDVTSDFQG